MNLESVLKKSAFGGFTKESVFDLVEMLQKENVKLANEINESKKDKEKEIEKCNSLLAENEKVIEELNEKNSALLEANASYSLKLEEAQANKEDYEKKLDELKEKINDIEHKFDALQAKYGSLDEYEKSKEQANAVISSVREAVKGAVEKITLSSNNLKTSSASLFEASEKIISDTDLLIKSIVEISDEFCSDESEKAEKAVIEENENL